MTTLHQRTTLLAALTVLASLLPVVNLSPAYAAPAAEIGTFDVPRWTGSLSAASNGSTHGTGPSWRESDVLPADDVVLLGADWGGDHEVVVEVRSKKASQWSEWVELHLADDHTPEAGAEPSSTSSDPVWVGLADAVQLRTTSSAPESIELHGVRIEGGETALRRTATQQQPAATAEAMTQQPTIISRAGWGADESRRRGETAYASNVRFAVVHHTTNNNSYQSWESDDIVRSIYAYHTGANGWDDIGYNFLVNRFGQVFEGRAGGIDRAVIGAHAAGFNSGSTGVAVMGDFQAAAPSSSSLSALRNLLAWKLDIHHVDPLGSTDEVAGKGSRFANGSSVTLPTIIGHRDAGHTACPGARLYDVIDSGSLARDVAAVGTPKLYTDVDPKLSQVRGDGTSFKVTASQRVDWTARVVDTQGRVVSSSGGRGHSSWTVRWDHRDEDGHLAPPGQFRVEVDASAGAQTARRVTVDVLLATAPPTAAENPRPVLPPDGAIRVVGDWDGDGVDTPGWFKDGRWGMHDRSHRDGITTLLTYGRAGDRPVVGDWDGDGVDTVGVVRNVNGKARFILRNVYRSGADDIVLDYGRSTDTPVVGDWDGDGTTTLGVVRNVDGRARFILRNVYRSGADDIVMTYGNATDTPVVGDWDGNGTTTLGVVRNVDDRARFILRNVYRSGADDIVMTYGNASDVPVVGDWDGDREVTLGVVRGTRWILRNDYRSGALDYVFDF